MGSTAGGTGGAASGPITVGAYTPDWKALIESDPGLLEAQGALSAAGVANAAQRDEAIRKAYIAFGGNIDFATLAKQLGMSEADVQQALGADTQQLAQENTAAGLSTRARLDQANQDAIAHIRAELNRRGMLNSGETGYQFDRQGLGYRQSSSDAYQRLLDTLEGYQNSYTSAEQQRQEQLAAAYSSAADRVYANNQSTAGVSATLDHVDPSGNPVYRGPDGTLYNADGSPYTASPPAAQAAGGVSEGPSAAAELYYSPTTGLTQQGRPLHGIAGV